MGDNIHRVGITAPPKKVYAAVATVEGVAGWWTQDATGVSDVGRTLTFRFQSPTGEEIGKFDIEVLELIPDKKVRWRVKSGPEEWVGTDIEFSLSQEGDYTVVLFGHRNWREAVELRPTAA